MVAEGDYSNNAHQAEGKSHCSFQRRFACRMRSQGTARQRFGL